MCIQKEKKNILTNILTYIPGLIYLCPQDNENIYMGKKGHKWKKFEKPVLRRAVEQQDSSTFKIYVFIQLTGVETNL